MTQGAGPDRAVGDSVRQSDTRPALFVVGAPDDWRQWLRDHAHQAQRALLAQREELRLAGDVGRLAGRLDVHAPHMLDPLLLHGFSAHRAREALRTVDRFVLGWCFDQATMVAEGAGNSPAGRDADFEFGLEALIAGIAAVGEQPLPSALRMRRRAVPIGLRALLRHFRQCADSAFQAGGLAELERRLLLEVFTRRGARSSVLTAVSGVDKAQVSRALRRLGDLGLIRREGIRAPFEATDGGSQRAQDILAVATPLHHAAVAGIDPAALREFQAVVAEMTLGAVRLLDQEEQAAAGLDRDVAGEAEARLREAGAAPQRPGLLLPQLVTLFTYMQRSGAMMIRRLADLASFEWLVLSTIAEAEPLTPARLVASVERDHSQARRTLRRLLETGLIDRPDLPGRLGRMLRMTEQGRTVARRLEDEGWRRDDALYGAIAPDRLERFLAVLDALNENLLACAERGRSNA